MQQKLINKGFEHKAYDGEEYFEGEFNGTQVHIHIGTNNYKVYRIMIADANLQDEANIKIRFNKLVQQFEHNPRYFTTDEYTLSDKEDISYEMSVNKKIYEAVYYQLPDTTIDNSEYINSLALSYLLTKYTEDQILNPTEEIAKEYQEIIANKVLLHITLQKAVWFRITEYYGEYYITMYYDNLYNQANGEDL